MPGVIDKIRPDIAQLEAYTPIVPPHVLAERLGIPQEQIVKLDANENPYGPSPAVRDALSNIQAFAYYPDPDHMRLRTALSGYTGLPVERIFCGAGADEVIDLLMRLFLQPGDGVIDCPPTFGMYRFDTEVCGGKVISVPRNEDFSLNIAAIEQAAHETHAKMLFVASPNNPTGNVTPSDEIERLLQLPLLVVVDEAYVEFSSKPRGASDLVGLHENLVVLRTFSKWAGLAGLRVGYGLLHENLAAHLWKIKQPYNVNVAAELAVLATLEHIEDVLDNVARIVFERERMMIALPKISFLQVYPSQANFIFCRVVQREAKQVKHALEQRGILVRYYQKAGLQDCIRISIGTPDQMNTLQDTLQELDRHVG